MRKECTFVPDRQKVGAMIDHSVHWLSKELDLQSRKVLFGLFGDMYMNMNKF